MRTTTAWMAMVGVAGVMGGAVATGALGAQVEGEAIVACAHMDTGDLRVVQDADDCIDGERVITWERTGPRGEAGPTGPAGAGIVDVDIDLEPEIEEPIAELQPIEGTDGSQLRLLLRVPADALGDRSPLRDVVVTPVGPGEAPAGVLEPDDGGQILRLDLPVPRYPLAIFVCPGCDLTDLPSGRFDGASLVDAHLPGAALEDLPDTVDLTGAMLRGAHIRTAPGLLAPDADLDGASLVDIPGARLTAASLRSARLRGDWAGSTLQDTVLSRAVLRGADLRGSDLRGTTARGADLRRVDLRDADLRSADLVGADLRGADLTGADLSGAQVAGVSWRDATCPDGSPAGAPAGDAPDVQFDPPPRCTAEP